MASVALSAERERRTENVLHMLLMREHVRYLKYQSRDRTSCSESTVAFSKPLLYWPLTHGPRHRKIRKSKIREVSLYLNFHAVRRIFLLKYFLHEKSFFAALRRGCKITFVVDLSSTHLSKKKYIYIYNKYIANKYSCAL